MEDDETKQSTALAVQDRGHFWWAEELPPDHHHLPPSAVTGELKITQEGHITVGLDAMLPRQPGESFHTSSQAEFENIRARRIRGVLRDSGRGVLLFDPVQQGVRRSSYAVSTEGFLAAQCLISRRQFDGRIKEPAFSNIDASLKGFEEWVWPNALKWKHGKIISSAKYRKPKPISYRLKDGRLSMIQYLSGSAGEYSGVTWSESAYLRYKPDKAIRLEAAIEWHRWLQDLMVLLTDSDYCLQWPEVRWGIMSL